MRQIVGNESPVAILKSSIKSDSIHHSYLFEGPEHIGKLTVAKEFAMALNCKSEDRPCLECSQCKRIANHTHADVEFIGLDDNDKVSSRQDVISIEKVREIQKKISLSPFEGKYRVLIFCNADSLTLEASNCLLKTLESPPEGVVIILLTLNSATLLSTVISRCLIIQFKPVSNILIKNYLLNHYAINEQKAIEISRISNGCPGWAMTAMEDEVFLEEFNSIVDKIEMTIKGDLSLRFEYADDAANMYKKDRKSVKDELYIWLNYWRDILLAKVGSIELVIHNSRLEFLKLIGNQMSIVAIFDVITKLIGTLNLLDSNVNANLALEQFVLSLPITNLEVN